MIYESIFTYVTVAFAKPEAETNTETKPKSN